MLLLAFLIIGQSYAQSWERELYFRNISADDGLSNPTVNCIYEDKRGYIWIGTIDGLNRFDGYEFKVYQSSLTDSNSIPNNRINVLYEDSNYNLWIGTPEGLCQFNYQSETFQNFKSGEGFDQVFDIAHDEINKRIWIVSSSGQLKYLDLQSGLIETYYNNELIRSVVYKLLIVDDELYIGTSNKGLFKLQLNTFIFEEFCSMTSGRCGLPSNWITALHFYNNKLLIGTEKGLTKYNFGDGKSKSFSSQYSNLPYTSIFSITHDSQGDIFLGTEEGIAILNDRTELVSFNQQEEGNFTTLSSNLIRTVFVDSHDDVWVGTIQKGIDYLNKESRNMTLVKKKYSVKNTLSGSSISSFAQDNKGGIWIGTKENGLNYYVDDRYVFFPEIRSTENSTNNSNVSDICIDDYGTVWASIYNGGLYTIKDGKVRQYRKDESDANALHTSKIRKIDAGIDGVIWLASEEGLESYDAKKGVFSHHYVSTERQNTGKRKNIRAVLSSSEGKIYAGTNTGLYVYDPASGLSDHYQTDLSDSNALGHNIVVEIFEDSESRIWLGTLGGGLIGFDKEREIFKSYSELNGFPDNSAKSIQEDDNGNLWIATNKGLVKFSPATEQVTIFGRSYGLQNNTFNINASLKCYDGRLIFGGTDGFNVFKPADLEITTDNLDVIITDIKLFDKSVSVSQDQSILTQNISLENEVNILYNQSKHFSLSFSALQFSDPQQVKYAYMMTGFDDGWHFIGNEHYVSFTNLAPKDYTFKVMASDNGVWNNAVTELKIIIPPPFYMQTWFRIAVLMLIIFFAVSFYYYKRYEYKKNQELLERLVDKKNKEISSQNEELRAMNEELVSQNEEVVLQRDHIDDQNLQLTKVKDELKIMNLTLEEKIRIRTKELEESNKTLDKAVKELDRFVYSASHDLSAPLKSILGLVNIAKLEDKDKNLQVHLNYIEKSIIKQEKVIKSLTQYSRNARQEIKPELIDIHEIVRLIALDLRYLPGSENVNIINKIAEGETVLTDKQRIKMILNNLLSNGVKYHDGDKSDSFVKIELAKKPKSWQLIVEDNGLGVAEDHKEKVFNMFHRATEASEGSGLGLFIVHEAIDRLGGKISLESELKRGSVFVIELPYL